MNLMDVGDFSGRRWYTGLRLDYRLRLWAPSSSLHTISVVADLVVYSSKSEKYFLFSNKVTGVKAKKERWNKLLS